MIGCEIVCRKNIINLLGSLLTPRLLLESQ
nr:MAG TPA: hypothetical protein [Caudoviricetes sp.]